MTSSIRYREITNTTGVAVLPGGALINFGKDIATETINVTLAAADVGAGAGQTQNANGMILAEFKGAQIKQVISTVVLRTAAGFAYEFLGTDAVSANYGFSITNVDTISTLRLKDLPTGAAGRLAAGDEIIVTLSIGNS
jgi:hypothetical protein